jgi:elongation factor G
MVVEPRSTADRDKLRTALARLAHEDPSFREREDEDTGQWYVSGMGELHLEVAMHRLESDFHVQANMGKPRVAYREAPSTVGRGAGRVERTLGGKDVFGAVEVEIRPRRAENGAPGVVVTFAPDVPVPAPFRAAVAEALEQAAQVGPRFGYPLVDAAVTVVGAESNPRIDAELGFVQAAVQALRNATAEALVDLLEPVMRFEIQTPEESTSAILADLNARRAEVESFGVQERLQGITGTVPLAQMFGYASAVRSLSQGRASYTMRPAGFRVVPEEELVARGLVWT